MFTARAFTITVVGTGLIVTPVTPSLHLSHDADVPPHVAHVTYPTRPAHCLTVTLELLLARRTPAGCGSRYRSPNEPGSDIPGYRTHDTPSQVPSHRDELTPTPAGEHYHLIRAHPKTAMPASWQCAHPLLTRELLQWWGCYSSVTLKDSRITGGPGRNFIRSIRCCRSHGQPRSLSPLCLVPVRCSCHHSNHPAWINVLGPVLPDAITSPDLRACWEHVARRINAYRDLTGWTPNVILPAPNQASTALPTNTTAPASPPRRHLTITQHLYPNRTHD